MLDTEEHKSQTTLESLFETEGAAANLIGLSYDEYWTGEPEKLYWCGVRFKTNQEQQLQERDTLAWLTGQYVMQAISINLASAFGKQGAPKPNYPELPMYVAEHNEQAKAKKQERDMMRSYNNFIAAAQSMGKLQT